MFLQVPFLMAVWYFFGKILYSICLLPMIEYCFWVFTILPILLWHLSAEILAQFMFFIISWVDSQQWNSLGQWVNALSEHLIKWTYYFFKSCTTYSSAFSTAPHHHLSPIIAKEVIKLRIFGNARNSKWFQFLINISLLVKWITLKPWSIISTQTLTSIGVCFNHGRLMAFCSLICGNTANTNLLQLILTLNPSSNL